jgi:hypothetical protein
MDASASLHHSRAARHPFQYIFIATSLSLHIQVADMEFGCASTVLMQNIEAHSDAVP